MDKRIVFIFLLVIFSLKFFDGVFAREGILKNIAYGYMLLSILISLPYFFKHTGGFVFPIQLISISIVISVFMAQYTWGQGLSYSATTIPYAIWFTFFYLLNANISIKTIEDIVLVYGIIYIILFLFQFTHNSVVYFGAHDEFVKDRGIIRVNFPGGGIFFLSCYMAINKVTSIKNRNKYWWLVYALIGLIIIVLQVTRQAIFVMLFFYLLHILQNIRRSYKIITIVVCAFASLVVINSNNVISKGLAEQQKEDMQAGGNYIRILETRYYLNDFTPNTISKVFGNGMFNDNSNYGKALIEVNETFGYYLSDVGLVEVYIVFGLFAVFGFILIFIKSFTLPLPSNYKYLKYYIWTIMLTCLTSDFLMSYYFLIATVLALYCYQHIYQQNKIAVFNSEI